MLRLRSKARRPGAVPGSVVFVGERKEERPRITVIDYDERGVDEREVEDVEDALPLKDSPTVSWLNVDGLHDTELIRRLGDALGLHPLLLEDVANTTQRPKFEDFGEYAIISLKSLSLEGDGEGMGVEHMSLVIGPRYVLSFQERAGDLFDQVRERIRSGRGRIRRMGPDYLAYSLVDAVVDGYFIVLEAMGERIEELDGELMAHPSEDTLRAIHRLKGQAIVLRRSVWPLREVASGIDRSESPLIRRATRVFLRDLYDHTVQVVDTMETYRDAITSLSDLYLSIISNRMNEVMKVLTIIATIFIPLTFIAGIYGMNFENMPELGWHYAYYVVWALIVAIGVGMLLYFRRLRWL